MNRKVNLEQAKERVKKNLGDEYTLVEFTPGKYEYSIIRHNCGEEYKVQNQHFFLNSRKENSKKGMCPKCINIEKYSKEKVQSIINELLDDSYIVLEYVNKRTPIKIFHKKCNSEIELYLGNIQKGQRCKNCECGFTKLSEDRKYTTEKFSKAIMKKYGDLFSLDGVYIDYNTHTNIKCNTCGNIFSSTPNNFIKAAYCPFCAASAGEQLIMKYLNKENIKFDFQKQIKIDEKTYKFDFFIEEKNIVIEYDGKQHFKPSFGHSLEERERNFQLTKERDSIKNKYCKENNITMFRIPYTKFNKIHEILLENKIISSTTIENTSEDGSE